MLILRPFAKPGILRGLDLSGLAKHVIAPSENRFLPGVRVFVPVPAPTIPVRRLIIRGREAFSRSFHAGCGAIARGERMQGTADRADHGARLGKDLRRTIPDRSGTASGGPSRAGWMRLEDEEIVLEIRIRVCLPAVAHPLHKSFRLVDRRNRFLPGGHGGASLDRVFPGEVMQ